MRPELQACARAEAEARCLATIWDWGITRTFAAVVVLSDVHDTFGFLKVDEATICCASVSRRFQSGF